MPATRRRRADRLRAIPLPAVLRALGARPDRHDHNKWHAAAGVISVTGARFMDWSRGTGGGGAIDLAMHLQNTRFAEALDWLERQFGAEAPWPAGQTGAPATNPTAALPRTFCPPTQHCGHLEPVRRYLLQRRALAGPAIDALVRRGDLYADAHANAVFILRDETSEPVGAELRGTGPRPWRGMAPGSRKDAGFFSFPADAPAISQPLEAPIILCESAIDALSACQLHPGWRALSTAGARPDPAWLAPLLARNPTLYCGYDADPTGDRMAAALIARHRAIKRLRPSLKDWNDTLLART